MQHNKYVCFASSRELHFVATVPTGSAPVKSKNTLVLLIPALLVLMPVWSVSIILYLVFPTEKEKNKTNKKKQPADLQLLL